ncbi:sterol desaturase/sphingolipid hydroxylase (fatty acid hydroxylase superfamily) [Chitinophaga dinghuensis]|uniref:Sterol desaturase/sphingolipid hydroxylase (Fatty acid hydroxylase superfamily) n=1 Tax=Chitinophaga dinghuensis TaxID=1539050 RepID=A0A327VW34_9BACT|nr:sterol desaturase family protein [Chitinophaga dinghuensis]RAJ80211.1 sterol desaturase/sphingolipid hydroxylase (fatty acid hydroxylase superfamily) [Chitinophaga dinghuensis]
MWYLDTLMKMPAWQLFLVFLLQNLVVFGAALGLGYAIRHYFGISTPTITRKEWSVAGITVIINSLITLVGGMLWQSGFIRLSWGWSINVLTDTVLLLLAMDLLMYIFHYIIHHTVLYRYIHQLHHASIDPTPIDLFVLHPVETMGFGILWLMVLLSASFNLPAVIIYLCLNVIFGVVGHLGFEPLERHGSGQLKILQWIGTSRFHHAHHQDIKGNFGFYTSIWDRLFRTYLPENKQ